MENIVAKEIMYATKQFLKFRCCFLQSFAIGISTQARFLLASFKLPLQFMFIHKQL